MASGAKKDSEYYTNKAISSLKPVSYSDPFGTLAKGVFKPNLNSDQTQTLAHIDQGMNHLTSSIPTSYSVNDAYYNPFYNTTYSLYQQPTNTQYMTSMQNLDNDLNARGQLGSSYDALMRRGLNQNYLSQSANNAAQARLDASNAYLNALQYNLDALQGLGNAKSQMLSQIYMPAQQAVNYQHALTPLSQSTANVYSQQAQLIARQQAQEQQTQADMARAAANSQGGDTQRRAP